MPAAPGSQDTDVRSSSRSPTVQAASPIGPDSLSLPSSPPVRDLGMAGAMPPPTQPSRKRSHDDMNAADASQAAPASSVTLLGDDYQHAFQSNITSQTPWTAAKMPSAVAHTIVPPQVQPSRSLPSSQRPPQSAQKSISAKLTQEMPPPLMKPIHDKPEPMDEDVEEDGEADDPSTPSEPQDPLEVFAWRDLEQRYHDKIRELNLVEDGIIDEFDKLCDVSTYHVEAHSLSMLTDRSTLVSGRTLCNSTKLNEAISGPSRTLYKLYKHTDLSRRLKTQMTLVQHHEDELEKRRNHCTHPIRSCLMSVR